MRGKGSFVPRPIDRAVFGILAALFAANSIYLVGPWYLDTPYGQHSALYSLFANHTGVILYGVLVCFDSLALIFAAASKGGNVVYSRVVANALLAGFLLRLYSFIGVMAALDSWRPPDYLSHFATILLCGAFFLWVRLSERLAE
jgi:hypothetical protein